MATDFLKPVVSDPYATLLPGVNQAIVDLGKGLDPATSGVHTNVPTNTVRWNSATACWQLFNATSWVDLSALYGINISGNAATATTATSAGACTGNAATATTATSAGACTGNAATATTAGAVPWTGVSGKPLIAYSQEGSRDDTDYNTRLNTGFYNGDGAAPNGTNSYGQLLVLRGMDTGMQIAGGYLSDNLYFRGWAHGGTQFSPWRNVIHNGNIAAQNAGIGANQTWQDVLASRAAGTNYLNTTGKAISVSIVLLASPSVYQSILLIVDGKNVAYQSTVPPAGTNVLLTVCAVVPAGSAYSISIAGNIYYWSELR
jgi:hypothetical protein